MCWASRLNNLRRRPRGLILGFCAARAALPTSPRSTPYPKPAGSRLSKLCLRKAGARGEVRQDLKYSHAQHLKRKPHHHQDCPENFPRFCFFRPIALQS